MKNFLILSIPLLLISCKKNSETKMDFNILDSTSIKVQEKTKDSTTKQDSLIINSPAVEKVLKHGVNRSVVKNEILRTADASMLPFTIGDQFKEDHQTFVLKLTNVTQSQLNITVNSAKNMNIRIHQIQFPDKTLKGPFEKNLKIKTPQKGEYWIVLEKDSKANGEEKGHFSLKVE